MTTLEKVQVILADILQVGDAAEDASLIDNLYADSLDLVEIAIACEAEFDIQISDEEMAKVYTVRNLVRAVDRAIA